MKKIIFVALILLFALPASSEEEHNIIIKNGIVFMNMHTFRQLVTYVKKQNSRIEDLQNQLDAEREYSDKIEDCVRTNYRQGKAVFTCFGDQES